jgi:hypothetical protein
MTTDFEKFEIYTLEKAEMNAIKGGGHYEWIDDELVYVLD